MTIGEAVTRPTVLLVQGEPVLHTGVTTSLVQAGFNVVEAETTGEAWTTLETQHDVRVLFADLDISSGAEVLEFTCRVHDRWPSIGVVITSDHVRHLRPDEVPGDGCFLPRPLPEETLLQEVTMAADRMAA
jgi:CheY-like chemotaxis protein